MTRAYLGSALRCSVSTAVSIIAGGIALATLLYLAGLACALGLWGGN